MNMWGAIAYVSSAFSLAAFVTVIAAWILKGKSEEKGKLISLAEDKTKAKLVHEALEFFSIDPKGFTESNQVRIAMEQIRARANRFKTIALLIGFLAVVAASLSAYAINELNHYQTRPDYQFDGIKQKPKPETINIKPNPIQSKPPTTIAPVPLDPCKVPFDQKSLDCIFNSGE